MTTSASYSTIDARTRMAGNALRLSLVLLVAGILEFTLFLRQGLTHGNSLMGSLADANVLASLLTVLVSAAGIWLSRARQHMPAGILLGAVFVMGAYVADLTYADLGLTLGITTLLLLLALANTTIGGGRGWVFASLGMLAGAGLIAVDVLAQTPRLVLDSANILTYSYAGMLLIIAGLLFQSLQSSSLRTKMIFAFVLSTIVGIVFVSVSSNQLTRASLTDDAGNSLHALAEARAQTVGNLIDKQISLLLTLGLDRDIRSAAEASNNSYTGDSTSIQAMLLSRDQQWRAADAAANDNNPLVARVLGAESSSNLRSFRSEFPEHVEVLFTDKYGALIGATKRTPEYYQADKEWWTAAYNAGRGAVFLGQPQFDAGTKTQTIEVAIPLFGQDGRQVIGVLKAVLNLGFLRGALTTSENILHLDVVFPDNQLVSNDGSINVDPDPRAFQSLRTSVSPYQLLTYRGTPSLVSAVWAASSEQTSEQSQISLLRWLIIAYESQADALAPATSSARTSAVVSLLAIAVAVLAALGLTQLIIQPITRLTATVVQISGGDFSAQAPIESGDEIGTFAAAFNLMTSRLRDTVARMEQRVIERTADLRAANAVTERRINLLQSVSEIARAVSTVQDQPTLLQNVTQLIRRQFGYSYVGILLLDEKQEFVVLKASDGTGGQGMLTRGYQVKVGDESMVGQVARSGEARIGLDIGPSAVVFNNPDLPNTRSEMTLPLNVGQKNIGVLDLHSDQTVAFENEDTQILGTLANHVAIAIENAGMLTTTRQALEESQRAYQIYVKREWALMADRREQRGYRFAEAKLDVLNGEADRPEFEAAAASGETTSSATTLAIPLKVRGEVIGVIGVHASGSGRQWSESEVALIQAAADRVALTLENARLLQEAQRLAAKERTIGEITSRISATTDMDSILQIAAEELGRTLGGSEVVIQFQDRTGE